MIKKEKIFLFIIGFVSAAFLQNGKVYLGHLFSFIHNSILSFLWCRYFFEW